MKNLLNSTLTGLIPLLAALQGACRHRQPKACPDVARTLAVSKLSLTVLTGALPKDEAPTKREIKLRVQAAANRTRGFYLVDRRDCPGTWSMDLTVAFQDGSSNRKGRATVFLSLQLKENEKRNKPWNYQVVGDKAYKLKPAISPKDILLSTFQKTLEDILRYPATRLRLDRADADTVAGAILSGSLDGRDVATAVAARRATCILANAHGVVAPRICSAARVLCPALSSAVLYPKTSFEQDVTDMAIRRAGSGRMKKTMVLLLALLDAPTRAETQSAVLDAIVSIADPSSIDALVRIAEHKDSEDMARIIEAVGRIGGPKAEAFLQFLSDGSEDETIRNLARSTLKELHGKNVR